MFKDESIAPAPKPYGIANKINSQNWFEKANPAIPIIVRNILNATIVLVENFLINLSENKAEIIVQKETDIEINPIYETGTFNSAWIAGQAEPNVESGRPKEMKQIYIIAKSKVDIIINL